MKEISSVSRTIRYSDGTQQTDYEDSIVEIRITQHPNTEVEGRFTVKKEANRAELINILSNLTQATIGKLVGRSQQCVSKTLKADDDTRQE